MTVLISCAVVLLAFSLAGILIGPLPDFSDPLAVSTHFISLCKILSKIKPLRSVY